MTAVEVRDLLAKRYPSPEWRCERELTLNRRRLDVVAFRLWGGSGKAYQVLGFEIKVSRADWLRELASIDKSADWSSVVDQFYIVAVPGVVKPEELPRGWGLLETSAARTQLRLKAHAAACIPGPTLPRELVARLLTRSVTDQRPAINLEVAQARAEERTRVEREHRAALEQAGDAAAVLKALREQAGLHRYDDPVLALKTAHRVSDAVGHLPDSSAFEWAGRRVLELAENTAKHVQELNEATAVFRGLARAAEGNPEES